MSEVIIYKLSEVLTSTGVVEVARKEMELDEDWLTLSTLSRLRPGMTEAHWVTLIVNPLRELFRSYPEDWFLRTAKEYLDKGEKVAFGFLVDIECPESVFENILADMTLLFQKAAEEAKLPKARAKQSQRAKSAPSTPQQPNYTERDNPKFRKRTIVPGSKTPSLPPEELPTIVDFPDEVIERPLVGYHPDTMDRNLPVPKPSEYGHITGSMYKAGRGVSKIASTK